MPPLLNLTPRNMSVISRIKELMPKLDKSDGSVQVAEQWIEAVAKADEIQALMNNAVFSRIIEGHLKDARARMHTLCEADPELRAIRKLLVRTIGREQTARLVEEQVGKYLTTQEEEMGSTAS